MKHMFLMSSAMFGLDSCGLEPAGNSGRGAPDVRCGQSCECRVLVQDDEGGGHIENAPEQRHGQVTTRKAN